MKQLDFSQVHTEQYGYYLFYAHPTRNALAWLQKKRGWTKKNVHVFIPILRRIPPDCGEAVLRMHIGPNLGINFKDAYYLY